MSIKSTKNKTELSNDGIFSSSEAVSIAAMEKLHSTSESILLVRTETSAQ
jgi:hypothetical protein